MCSSDLSPFFELPTTGLWTVILLIYAFIASVLPVGLLLQPRDYLNAWQLYVAMGLIVLGLIWTSLTKTFPLVAPVINLQPEGAPSMWPFLFITIACGAVSGFHCLVCSGTSSKQISSEQDTQFVGYGSMMMEAALATLIVVAVCAGIGLGYDSGSGIVTGSQAWQSHYGSWQSSAGLGSKLTAVVLGCANMMGSFGMPYTVSVAIVGVFIASFAGTTLDSASRVQRYIISELMTCIGVPRLSNKWIATTIAIVSAACLAFSTGADGKGALQLWPLFGAVNQLLAGLALMVITAYIRSRSGSLWTASIAGGPCLILMIITIWASVSNQIQYISEGKLLLSCINLSILILAVFMSFETVLSLSGKAIDREARS